MFEIPDKETLEFYAELLETQFNELAGLALTFLPYGIGDAADVYQNCGSANWNCALAIVGIVVPFDELYSIWRNADKFKAVWKTVKGYKHLKRAWQGLKSRPKWVRTNTDLLGKLTGKSDAFIAKVDDFYANHVKLPSGWKNDPDLKLPKLCQGIEFNKIGFPNFKGSQVASPVNKVEIVMQGTRAKDYNKARDALLAELKKTDPDAIVTASSPFEITYNGIKSEKMTWHHVEDGKTMQAVKTSIHTKVQGKHTGGFAITKDGSIFKDLINFFN